MHTMYNTHTHTLQHGSRLLLYSRWLLISTHTLTSLLLLCPPFFRRTVKRRRRRRPPTSVDGWRRQQADDDVQFVIAQQRRKRSEEWCAPPIEKNLREREGRLRAELSRDLAETTVLSPSAGNAQQTGSQQQTSIVVHRRTVPRC